jgi:hypothetical protein
MDAYIFEKSADLKLEALAEKDRGRTTTVELTRLSEKYEKSGIRDADQIRDEVPPRLRLQTIHCRSI